MNVVESFANFLANITDKTFSADADTDIFIGEAPSGNKVSKPIFWIVASGGSPTKLVTKERQKLYTFYVYYRDRDYKAAYNQIFELEAAINCEGCTQLDGYDTISIETAVLSIDDDLDQEDRKVGLLQVNLTTLECQT